MQCEINQRKQLEIEPALVAIRAASIGTIPLSVATRLIEVSLVDILPPLPLDSTPKQEDVLPVIKETKKRKTNATDEKKAKKKTKKTSS